MIIVHICLNNYYKNNFGYQENLLTRAQKGIGHDVYIMAPAEEVVDGVSHYIENDYINEDGIPVVIIKKKTQYFERVMFAYFDFMRRLEELNPDIIFVHGGQSINLLKIKKYCKNHVNCRLYVDQHIDYYNTPARTLRRKFQLRVLYKYFMHHNRKYVTKFWGTTPWRCEYMNDVYHIENDKIGLLVMGGDDDKIHFDKKNEIRQEIRRKYKISDDDFLIVSGGRIDKTKNIHLLAEAVEKLKNSKVKVIIFGNLTKDMQVEFDKYNNSEKVKLAGWIPSDEAYNYFLASDLAVFPGTHSVLWEQACACGIPIVVKDWIGMHHVDLGGNCKFLKEDSSIEIDNVINDLVNNKELYYNMYQVAQEKCIKEFSYREIAKRAIEEVR